MATYAVEERSVSLSRIFSRMFGVMGANPGLIFGMSFVFGALPMAIMSVVVRAMVGAGSGLGVAMTALTSGIIGVLFGALAQGALVSAAVAAAEGRRMPFGESLAIGLNRMLPVLAVVLLDGIAIGLGMILLIVPGVIVAVMWSVAMPVVVIERSGIGAAFSRSAELTSGARWKIFGLFLVIAVIFILGGIVLGIALVGTGGLPGAANAAPGPIGLLINVVFRTLVTAVFTALSASLYLELRNWKDGPLNQSLGTIFE